jgi:lysylphosphatidylglycerol synthase-like protein
LIEKTPRPGCSWRSGLRSIFARRSSLILAALLLAVPGMIILGGSWGRLVEPLSVVASVRWEWAIGAVACEAAFVTVGGLVWVLAMWGAGVGDCSVHRLIGAQWLGRASSCVLVGPLAGATQASAALRDPPAREAGVGKVVGSIGAQRIIENGVAGLIAAVVVVIYPGPLAPLRPVAAALLVLLPVAAVLLHRLGRARAASLAPARLRRLLRPLGEGACLLVHPRRLGRAGALQALAAICRLGALACLLAALGFPPQAAPLAFCLILIAGALPALPGGAGTRELALVPCLVAGFGLNAGQALGVSLGVQALVASTALLAMPYALATLWRTPQRLVPAPLAASAGP